MNYITSIVRNSSHLADQPPSLALDVGGVDDRAVPGNKRCIGSAGIEDPAQRRRPGGPIGVPVDDGITGLLHQVSAEDDGRVWSRHDDDEVVVGMSRPGWVIVTVLPPRSTSA